MEVYILYILRIRMNYFIKQLIFVSYSFNVLDNFIYM